MALDIRRAKASDRPRILAISSQIWEGDDYVPRVLDEWIDDRTGEFAVVKSEGTLIAFARRSLLFPGYAWLQGIRTDPAHRGRGAGRALTAHFIEQCRREGLESVGLSTYVDNEASIHIITSCGFQRKASFVLAEAPCLKSRMPSDNAHHAQPVGKDAATAFVRASSWNHVAGGYYALGWTAYPVERASAAALARTPYRIGVFGKTGLQSLLCASPPQDPDGVAYLGFLDGLSEDFDVLLARMAEQFAANGVLAMLPRHGEQGVSALAALSQWGFGFWNQGTEDVFIYELDLSHPRRPKV
jgi:GNAT superfamily N-acetyltransferase